MHLLQEDYTISVESGFDALQDIYTSPFLDRSEYQTCSSPRPMEVREQDRRLRTRLLYCNSGFGIAILDISFFRPVLLCHVASLFLFLNKETTGVNVFAVSWIFFIFFRNRAIRSTRLKK